MSFNSQRCHEVLNDLSELKIRRSTLTAPEMRKVIAILKKHQATYDDFGMLDEKPGYFGYKINGKEWHWKLRQTRNRMTAELFALWEKQAT